MAKIAVITVPFYSHSAAAMRLAAVLVSQGHELVLWGPERHRKQVEEWGARFEPHEPPMPQTAGLGFSMELLETTERITGDLVEQVYASGSEILIHDSQAPWARVAGEYLGLARLVAHPMFPIVAPYAKPSQSDPHLPAPPDHEATERVNASWAGIARRWGVEIEGDTAIHSAGHAMLAFTTQRILGSHLLGPHWALMGPLMSPPPPTERPKGRPLVYACLGTAYNARAEPFKAVIAALADEPVDVLISTGDGKWVTEAELGPLPENVTVRSFVPAREVLARASVHITHGGCNSAHESMLAAVPMVVLPQAFDQFPMARAISNLGIGVGADEAPFEVREAVRLLLESDKAQTAAREVAQHLLEYPGAARVAEVIERVLAEDAEGAEDAIVV